MCNCDKCLIKREFWKVEYKHYRDMLDFCLDVIFHYKEMAYKFNAKNPGSVITPEKMKSQSIEVAQGCRISLERAERVISNLAKIS